MPGCVFRVSGVELDLDQASSLSFDINLSYRKGEERERQPGEFYEESRFCVVASDSSDRLELQIQDAESFLREYFDEIKSLKGVDHLAIDFGYDCRIGSGPPGNEILVQGETLPCSLLKLCGELGIDIWLSMYSTSDQFKHDECH